MSIVTEISVRGAASRFHDRSTSSTAFPEMLRSRKGVVTCRMSRQLRSSPICGFSEPCAIIVTSKARSGANRSSASDVK